MIPDNLIYNALPIGKIFGVQMGKSDILTGQESWTKISCSQRPHCHFLWAKTTTIKIFPQKPHHTYPGVK